MPAAPIRAAVLAQPPGGQAQAHADQVRPGPVDSGLGVRALSGPQRHPADLAEFPAERLLLPGGGQRLAHLAQDLAFADHHRVEPADDLEQVLQGPVLVVHVQVRRQLGQRDAGVPGQQLADRADPTVELVHVGVDLDPVAGRNDEGAGHVLGRRDVAAQLAQLVAADRGALQDRDGRAFVAQPDHEHAHEPTA
jgi:hypothetical protein